MKRLTMGITGLAALTACASEPAAILPADHNGPPVRTLVADVRNALGQVKAEATAAQMGDSIRVRLTAITMPQGAYGAHIHTTGRCDPPAFESAGPHWNPTGMKHGKSNPQGMHKGDLPNLMVGTDGRGTLEMTIPQASLADGPLAMIDADGAAIVIHAAADDYRTDPSGNSGARIACGVFR